MPPAQSAIDSTVRQFLDGLASDAPTPGGGSAAALAGALGAGLVSMVCQFTVGREKYAAVDADMQRVLRQSEALRVELQGAVDGDIAAYGSYRAASAMAKETDEERAARDAALDAASRASTDVPLRVAEWCAELLELALEAAQKGNPNLISDAGVGAQLAQAALRSALLNVRLNLNWIDDTAYVQGVTERLEAVDRRSRMPELVQETMDVVVERAGG